MQDGTCKDYHYLQFIFKYNKTNVYTSETPTLNLYCTIVYYANALYNVTCIFMLFVYASMF